MVIIWKQVRVADPTFLGYFIDKGVASAAKVVRKVMFLKSFLCFSKSYGESVMSQTTFMFLMANFARWLCQSSGYDFSRFLWFLIFRILYSFGCYRKTMQRPPLGNARDYARRTLRKLTKLYKAWNSLKRENTKPPL